MVAISALPEILHQHQVAPGIVELCVEKRLAVGGNGLKLGLEFAANHPQAVPAMQLALMHGRLGNMDTAFENLKQAIEGHDPGLVHLAVGPQWDCLRSDSRFQDALSRMGLSVA